MFTDMSLSEDLNKSFYEDLARKNSALDITASYLILQVICSTCCRYYPADNRYLPIILKSIMGKITKWPTNKMYYLCIEFYSVSFFLQYTLCWIKFVLNLAVEV